MEGRYDLPTTTSRTSPLAAPLLKANKAGGGATITFQVTHTHHVSHTYNGVFQHPTPDLDWGEDEGALGDEMALCDDEEMEDELLTPE